MGRGLILGLVLALGLVIASGLYLRQWWNAPLDLPDEGLTLLVKPGQGLGVLTRNLARDGVLQHRRLLNLIARLTEADQRIGEGEYHVEVGTSPRALLALLQSGATVRYLVTLPEGIRLSDALKILWESEGLKATLAGPDDPRLLAMVAPAAVAEGFFLPETYQYERGDTDLQVLREAHRLMIHELGEAWAARHEGLPLNSPYEALVLASIIEKETGVAHERGQIGGVFVRRLEKGMRLQTDPTVIYGLGVDFDGDLKRKHLKDDSNPYNSYRHHGLPPGPIALPGRAALLAAVQPESGDSLYFVARGDGSHEFSATLDEHEAAVNRYQRQRRADYRSSPSP